MNHVFHIADYNSPLPEMIYLDSGFIYEVYGDNPENKFADDCYNFTNRLAANGSIMIISALAIHELDHVILKGIYKKYARLSRHDIGWLDLYKQTKEHMPEVSAEIERVTKLFRGNPNIVEVPVIMDEQFIAIRRKFMLDFLLDVTDAGHIVSASQNTVNSYAVIDADYQNVSEINIFTPNLNYPRLGTTPRRLILPPELPETGESKD